MKVDKNIAELICELEYLIGTQTYNPNSYNGWTGEEGCGFRYPVNYCKSKENLEAHTLTKTRSQINYIDPACIGTMKYAFGSNHLYIGDGIVEVLSYLERIYNIDFNKLEQKRTEKRKKNLMKINEKLKKGEIVKVGSGIKVVGIDIPVGKIAIVNLREKYFSHIMVDIYNEKYEYENHIFSDDDQVVIILKEGNYIKANSPFALKSVDN